MPVQLHRHFCFLHGSLLTHLALSGKGFHAFRGANQ